MSVIQSSVLIVSAVINHEPGRVGCKRVVAFN